MKMTVSGFLQLISLIPFLLFAGYFLVVQKDVLNSLLFLLLDFMNFLLVSRNPEGKQTSFAARIALSWTIILMSVDAFLIDLPLRISVLMIPVPLGILFLWIALTGK